MKIAVLGWGSLIKEPNGLRVGKWRRGGPLLPIELSRLSRKRGHLTYVIDERHKSFLPAQYATSQLIRLADAVGDLARREGCPRHRIGYVKATPGTRHRSRTGQWRGIQRWAAKNGFDAVIWTDLPPRPGRFTVEAAVRAWKRLPAAKQQAAAAYVRMAPSETDTNLRRRLKEERLI